MLGYVVIDNMADISDIQAAGGDICGHEHFKPAVPEAVERLFPFLLGPVGMQHAYGMFIFLEQAGNPVRAMFGAAENDHRIVMHPVQQGEQQVRFLRIGDRINDVLDGFRRSPAGTDFNRFRIVHGPLNERLNLGRNGGGE